MYKLAKNVHKEKGLLYKKLSILRFFFFFFFFFFFKKKKKKKKKKKTEN